MPDIEAILIVSIVFGAIVAVFKIITDYKTRKELIEKGEVNDSVKSLYDKFSKSSGVLSDLKWGFVLVGIGLAMVSKEIFPYYISNETVLGMMFLFSGVGFLAYYFIASNKRDSGNNGQS